ncbi:MAG: Xaa-Pro peptidase family protein [Paracoccaceae bacterium]|nr:Xaa-Pro peptidase family protein [Paracoccaceae bacterium]
MTLGVGGSTIEKELRSMQVLSKNVKAIPKSEYYERIKKATNLMKKYNVDAIFLSCSTNLRYFVNLDICLSERLHAAIINKLGDIIYITPTFEKQKTKTLITISGEIFTWEEDEDPAIITMKCFSHLEISKGTIAIDENTPFFIFDALQKANKTHKFVNAQVITKNCREIKSQNEIKLIQTAMNVALEVQRRTARILYPGITTGEVQNFVSTAHKKLGSDTPPAFNIVLFGEASAYPHGVSYSQSLQEGDIVLLDMGATVGGYYSDITRTYVFGKPTQKQRKIWEVERGAQNALFEAAQIGAPCENLDSAARNYLEKFGLGPGYKTPGLPHRAGHGLGLDIHEHPYIVKGNTDNIAEGMCFSNEPMICMYGEFGVRLEDHIYMTSSGPKWFTTPALSIDNPFGQD